jgi:hypothetical protein
MKKNDIEEKTPLAKRQILLEILGSVENQIVYDSS